jgi:hypothetical protein
MRLVPKTDLASVLYFVAWMAIAVAAIQAGEAGQRLVVGLCVGAAALLSIGSWWEDRASKRTIGHIELLKKMRDSIHPSTADFVEVRRSEDELRRDVSYIKGSVYDQDGITVPGFRFLGGDPYDVKNWERLLNAPDDTKRSV